MIGCVSAVARLVRTELGKLAQVLFEDIILLSSHMVLGELGLKSRPSRVQVCTCSEILSFLPPTPSSLKLYLGV